LLAGPKLIAPSALPSEHLPKPKQKLPQKLPVREDHGLYAFFRRKSDDTLVGENRFEVLETPDTYQVLTGMVVSSV
jgi:large subunit ribosomal protein L47